MKTRIKKLAIIIEINISAVALTTIGGGIVRSKIVTLLWPLRVDLIDCTRMANEVVLTPPAVDPGEPPINIKSDIA